MISDIFAKSPISILLLGTTEQQVPMAVVTTSVKSLSVDAAVLLASEHVLQK